MADQETTEAAESPESGTAAETKERGLRKTRVGVVVSAKMDKTIAVDVVRRVPHPHFGKIVKRSKRLFAHDENREAVEGDKVMVEETRPISKRKCWKLVKVLAH